MHHMSTGNRPLHGRPRERGIVLIIAMIMLIVISLLTSLSVRNALSSEGVSGNVRTTQLANQAAEVALRVCEDAVTTYITALATNPAATLPTGMTALASVTPARYSDVATYWDVSPTHASIYKVPLSAVNLSSSATFDRSPECLIERVDVLNVANTAISNTRTFLITARGFGPEVKDTTSAGGRPVGTEVFLQSVLEVD